MITVDYQQADKFVSTLQDKGVEVSWDGWDMVFWSEHKAAVRNVSGRRRENRWGFERVIVPDNNGEWLVPHNLTKRPVLARR